MKTFWILTIAIFLISAFVYWKTTHTYFKNEVFSKGSWNSWTTRFSYWQGVLFISTIITALSVYSFKWIGVLTP